MINTTPLWSYRPRFGFQPGWRRRWFLDGKVYGEWFALDRLTGKCLWENRLSLRSKTIEAIDGDIIIASDTEFGYGCYAYSTQTGKLVWQWHGPGLWGAFVRMLDNIPFFSNELRPTILWIRDGECLLTPNLILCVKSGKVLRRELDTSKCVGIWKSSRAPGQSILYNSNGTDVNKSYRSDNSWCSAVGGLNEIVVDYGCVRAEGISYTIGGEEEENVYDPNFPYNRKSMHYQLIIKNTNTGTILQRFRLPGGKKTNCQLKYIDETALLIEYEDQVDYFEFIAQ